MFSSVRLACSADTGTKLSPALMKLISLDDRKMRPLDLMSSLTPSSFWAYQLSEPFWGSIFPLSSSKRPASLHPWTLFVDR